MKNLKVLLQKSILIFVVLFIVACEKNEEHFAPVAPLYDSLSVYPQTDNPTPPVVIPLDKLDKPANFRYLTLYDATLKNTIIIKVKTDDKNLLNSLNAETVKFIALDGLLPGSVTAEAAKTNSLEIRSTLQQVEIEVLEINLQKNIRLYGIKFIHSDLIKSSNSYQFIYKNSNVRTVYAIGVDAIKDPSRFIVYSSDCPDCEIFDLAPHHIAAKNMISFYNTKQSNITLKANSKFTDDLMILW